MASSTVFCSTCGAQNLARNTSCISCGGSLPTSASGIAPSVTLTGLLPPQTLLKQRYRILHKVGKGGMGAVYLAQDTQLGDRQVAIKEMSQNSLDPDEVADAINGFKREAHLLAGLQHPNLPSIYDHFEEAKRWYLVMSFIQGQTLQDYLAQAQGGKLPVEEVLQIGIDLCTVLDHLHAYQPPIIFRDLKPANIMRTPKGHIYLIDFGIARHFKPGQAKDTANYGSAGYAPPEQYGKAQTTPRSDIYSLGATLYQLLSGYEPSASPFRLPPLQSLVPTLPAKLFSLITQMLDMDDSRRPANMNVVKKELQEIATSLSSAPPALHAQTPVAPTMPAIQPFASKVLVPPSPQIMSSSLNKVSLDSPRTGTWSLTTERIVIAGVLAAITIVLGLVPGIGFIPVPTISAHATIEHVPTILGGVLAGPVVGIISGLIFGIMSFTQATTPLFKDPLVAILPRLFIGLVAWAVFAGLKPFNRDVAAGAAGFLGSVTNTVLVVAMLIIRGYIPLAVALTLIPQALAEAIVATILTVILARVFYIIQKRYIHAVDTKPRSELPY